ncbi:MAG TPA: hypothetical protein VG733_11340 [Chthoniobacteraceae bacterium]|nr:hypothetical protein [Chthoniobacteraceae bacterium]
MANRVIHDFFDPQYVMKYEALRARIRENPGRPLWLVMGSSRVERGLRPELLNGAQGDANAPMVYNFGLGGASLFREFMCLRRVLESGIQPRVVGIELLGAALSSDVFDESGSPILLIRARKDELPDYIKHGADPGVLLPTWRESRWNPFYEFGMRMPKQTLAWRLIPLPGMRRIEGVPYNKWGWYPEPPAPIPESDYQRAFAIAKSQFANRFDNFQISSKSDFPLRAMLDLCKARGITVFLLKMPEDNDFRSFYTPEADARIAAYIQQIQRDYPPAPLIDATTWIPKEGFTDGHHLNATGAEAFTHRFGEELFKTVEAKSAQ